MYWVAALSGILNCLFLLDFMTLAFAGESLAGMLLGTESSVVNIVTEHIPGMSPWEFFLANAFILSFVVVIMLISIYIAFYSDRRECYLGKNECGACEVRK
ncbi:MAG TPA: hypothetical protein VJY42_05055 [Candidatus Methanomethylophilaceae archaeon]|nr:hypothetical protein [Candidatus Methanomethylophilaceae archaeon]